MKEKRIAVVLLYDKDFKLLLQDRHQFSKFGEQWGLFGGKIEEGESPEEAVIREVEEELEFSLQEPKYLGAYSGIGTSVKDATLQVKIHFEVFAEEITQEDYESMVLHEGDGMQWFSVEEAKKLHMEPTDPNIFLDFEKKIMK